jgi:broad-specificity NMP kinase
MLEVQNIDELLCILQAIGPRSQVITIDGWHGSGKSTLASDLANRMGAIHLDLDSFLIQDQRVFVEAIQYEQLQSAIEKSGNSLIISGVCMLEVLERVDVVPAHKIYVKRMTDWGWADQDEIEGQMLETVAAALGKQVSEFVLSLEVRTYHRSYMPHENADIAFLRYERPD